MITHQVNLKGQAIKLGGKLPQTGEEAPDFNLIDQDMASLTLQSFSEKIKIILAVPSLDTPVCALQTRIFNEKMGKQNEVAIIVASGDLPFAMKRFCSTEGITNVFVGSQYRDMNFSKAYGTHILEGGLQELSARAIFIIDKNNIVQYIELVPEIINEPDYAQATKAIEKLLS